MKIFKEMDWRGFPIEIKILFYQLAQLEKDVSVCLSSELRVIYGVTI